MGFITSNLKGIIWAVIAIISIVTVLKYFHRIKKFLTEVKTELGKVSWSSRQELFGSTVVVIVITGITAVFIGIIDLALSKILSLMFK